MHGPLTAFIESIVIIFEVIGVLVMVAGLVIAAAVGIRTLLRERDGTLALRRLRSALGGAILLGLEVLVAADIVKSVTSALAIPDVLALGLVVVIRTVLSFTIQIEIDGHLPWRRALLESGAVQVARSVGDAFEHPSGEKAARETADGDAVSPELRGGPGERVS